MRLLAFLFIILCFNVFAQNGLIKNYYPSGKIESEINYVNGVRDGDAKFYWDNGNIKTELNYNNGKVDGLVKEYYPTGILKETYTIQDGKKQGPLTFYNEQGAFLSEIYYESGKRIIDQEPVQEEEVVNSPSESKPETIQEKPRENAPESETPAGVKSKTEEVSEVIEKVKETPQSIVDTMVGYLTTADVMPEPHGGWIWLYKKLSYPKEAREKKIEGTSKILAYIDEKGKVVDAKIAEGFNPLCDEAARNAVTYTRFKPALVKGHEVKIKMVIPVEFKLP